MTIRDLITNIKEKIKKANTPEETFKDDETRDKYLRSLRRERRVQLEEGEKERLKEIIANYKKQQIKRNMFGVQAKDQLVKRVNNLKKASIMHSGFYGGSKPKKKKEVWIG